jgi:3',5'-cyclic AMP phosphodiesterase CpdA
MPLPLRHILASLLVCLALAGPAAADVGIVAIGDFGVGGDRERSTGAAVQRFLGPRPADALVTLGDNDYTERPRAFRRNWTEAFGWAAADGLRVAGTLGNHDVRVDGGRYEFGRLGMPGRYYQRRVGDVALFLLDSNNLGPAQLRWLGGALARTDAVWKVVAFHHPPFSCGGYLGDKRVRRALVPLFERHDVDLVLSGHDHNYQRFRRAGVTYVVHGGGGARLYRLRTCPRWFPQRLAARKVHGWIYLRAAPGSLRVRAIGRWGGVQDDVVLYP